jgi:predicted nuclease with TOPRIM domain
MVHSTNTHQNRVVGDITIPIDTVMSKCHTPRVMFQNTVEETMHSRLWHEEDRVVEINERLKELAKAYNEYRDLQAEVEARQKRIRTLFSLVGPIDANAPEGRGGEHRVAISLLRESQEDLKEKLPLWQAMREYLRHVKEARIAEMEAFFQQIKFPEGNRQAMESALKRHPKTFKTRKEKREKYISLK